MQDCFMLLIVGGVFLVIGLAIMYWGRREEKDYFDALARRQGDAREFMEHWPPRPQPGALKLGGWVAIAVGGAVLIAGVIFCLVG
jgi:hypothetical protein